MMSEQKVFGWDYSPLGDQTEVWWVSCNHSITDHCPYCRIEELEAEVERLRELCEGHTSVIAADVMAVLSR